MELPTLVVMVLVLGLVWGGFLYFLVKALRSEREKRTASEPPHATPDDGT